MISCGLLSTCISSKSNEDNASGMSSSAISESLNSNSSTPCISNLSSFRLSKHSSSNSTVLLTYQKYSVDTLAEIMNRSLDHFSIGAARRAIEVTPATPALPLRVWKASMTSGVRAPSPTANALIMATFSLASATNISSSAGSHSRSTSLFLSIGALWLPSCFSNSETLSVAIPVWPVAIAWALAISSST